jgi:hypothetical protein
MYLQRTFLIVVTLASSVSAALAQGGKAEPLEIRFAQGHSSTVLGQTLSVGQEMEYSLTALAGQTLTIRNRNTSLFDVRVFSEENDVETEFDSSREMSIKLPASGVYYLFVRKKAVARPRRARFSIEVTIK